MAVPLQVPGCGTQPAIAQTSFLPGSAERSDLLIFRADQRAKSVCRPVIDLFGGAVLDSQFLPNEHGSWLFPSSRRPVYRTVPIGLAQSPGKRSCDGEFPASNPASRGTLVLVPLAGEGTLVGVNLFRRRPRHYGYNQDIENPSPAASRIRFAAIMPKRGSFLESLNGLLSFLERHWI